MAMSGILLRWHEARRLGLVWLDDRLAWQDDRRVHQSVVLQEGGLDPMDGRDSCQRRVAADVAGSVVGDSCAAAGAAAVVRQVLVV